MPDLTPEQLTVGWARRESKKAETPQPDDTVALTRVALTREAITEYLDGAIRFSRRCRDDPAARPEGTSERDFVCYVDAFQSVRTSLFGETLPPGA
jgi:hypothetical protein